MFLMSEVALHPGERLHTPNLPHVECRLITELIEEGSLFCLTRASHYQDYDGSISYPAQSGSVARAP